MYVLLTEIRNYKDSFDTASFIVMPQDKFEKYKVKTNDIIDETNDSIELTFGTDEQHCITHKEEYWNSIKITEVNEEEFKILQQLFGHPSDDTIRFGTNLYFFPLDNY